VWPELVSGFAWWPSWHLVLARCGPSWSLVSPGVAELASGSRPVWPELVSPDLVFWAGQPVRPLVPTSLASGGRCARRTVGPGPSHVQLRRCRLPGRSGGSLLAGRPVVAVRACGCRSGCGRWRFCACRVAVLARRCELARRFAPSGRFCACRAPEAPASVSGRLTTGSWGLHSSTTAPSPTRSWKSVVAEHQQSSRDQ
jgi:hypothetical protein